MWVAAIAFQIATAMVLGSCQLPIGEACGDGWCPDGQFCSASDPEHPVCMTTASVTAELIFGDISGPGNLDGIGAAARFARPFAVAVDAADNVYVTDNSDIHDVTIRKITPAGLVTTLVDIPGVKRVNVPTNPTDGSALAGVAVDKTGNVYVTQKFDNIIRKVTPAGVISTIGAEQGGYVDGPSTAARFNLLGGIAFDRDDNMFITDTGNQLIREMDSSENTITLAGGLAMTGTADGAGSAARFLFPSDVATDGANVYVADYPNHRIRKITSMQMVTTLAGGTNGELDGMGTDAEFSAPRAVTADAEGNVYATDEGGCTIRKVTPDGYVATLAGIRPAIAKIGCTGSSDGMGSAARFRAPEGIALDSAGNLFIADRDNATIRKLQPSTNQVTTFAGAAPQPGSTDGMSSTARFSMPAGVVVDAAGDWFIADQGNATIRKVTAGVVTTFAGLTSMTGNADGMGAVARFNSPTGAAIDAAGTIYISDKMNHTIRKLAPDGRVTTLAGMAGLKGSSDGIGAAASFNAPIGVTVDSSGTVYVADSGNHTIRKVTVDGVVSTLAGAAGTSGNVDGAAALFNAPSGIAVDPAGNVYVADTGNNTIRKVATDGAVSTLAGTAGMPGAMDGNGSAAQFSSPTGLVLDSTGNLYVIDSGNSTIRKITPDGATITIVGTAGKMGIVLGAHPGLASPSGLAILGDSLVVTDTDAILLLHHAVLP
jgi:sugar lactone lactonase YvrE